MSPVARDHLVKSSGTPTPSNSISAPVWEMSRMVHSTDGASGSAAIADLGACVAQTAREKREYGVIPRRAQDSCN